MELPYLYKELSLPSPLPHLLPDSNPVNLKKIMREYQSQMILKNGKHSTSVENNLYYLKPELEAWIKENICDSFNDVGLKYNFFTNERTFLAPHTDVTRHYVLIYNLLSGDGDLVFWKETNFPVQRQTFTRHLPANYDDLEEVLRIKTPSQKWFIMNGSVLHSVENLLNDRVQLQVSLNLNPFE